MRYLILLFALSSCSLFHSQEQFEMERLSDDVLAQKNGRGISIIITPIEEKK